MTYADSVIIPQFLPYDLWHAITTPARVLRRTKPMPSAPRCKNLTREQFADAAYLWRMFSYFLSHNTRHHCFPAGADWQLWMVYRDFNLVRKRAKSLDSIILDPTLSQINTVDQPGTLRWKNALLG